MKINRMLSRAFIAFSAFALLSVSLMALNNPQDVMNLVGTELPNTDAYSSIRGVYGGVGLTIVIALGYLLVCHVRLGVAFLTMLWGSYALCRLLTMLLDGPLGPFGSQWLMIESILFGLSLLLLVTSRSKPQF